MSFTTFSPPTLVTPVSIALSVTEQAQAFSENLQAQFQPVADPPEPAVIDLVDRELRAFSYAPISEPRLTNPADVQEDLRDLKFGKASGPNGILKGLSNIVHNA